MEPIRVLIVDDHTLFREGLAGLLGEREEMEVVGEARDGLEAVEKAKELMPDIILMDLRMARCDGLEATRLIKKDMPYAAIAMLTVSEKDEDLFEAMKAGAKGYILKTVTATELASVVAFIAQGHVVIAPAMAERLLAEFGTMAQKQDEASSGIARLTEKESEILTMVGQGLSNKEIARRLYVSEATVKTHLRNILEKLHLHNRIQAAVFAAEKGLLSSRKPSSA